MAQQYIGSRISLISKSDIRYRGLLHSIDPAASTVSLEQVRSMGTEGRKSNPADEIAPTDTLYEFIVFRAADVKDLSIEAAAEPKPEPPKPSVPDDPAIMSTTAPPPRQAPAQNPFMPPHMMQPPQGMYNTSMPPLMYPPNNVPSQWPGNYLPPPPPGQPMMGFPPQQPQPPMGPGQAAPPSAIGAQSGAVPVSGTSGKTPAPQSSKTGLPQIDPKVAPPPSASPSKQQNSALGSGKSSSISPAPGPNTGMPVGPSKTPVSGRPNGATPTKGIFGAPTTMEMMSALATSGSASSAGQPSKHPQNAAPVPGPKAPQSQSSASINSILPKKDGTQPGNYNKPPNGNHSQHHPQPGQHNLRHPLPQVPSAKGKPHPGGHQANQGSNFVVPLQDFDFASANAKFQKAAPNPQKATAAPVNGTQGEAKTGEVDQLSSATENLSLKPKEEASKDDDFFIPEAAPGSYYDKKKSFFDDISSEVKERSAINQEVGRGGGNPGLNRATEGRGTGRGRGRGSWDRNAERQKNLDTFGEVALNPNLGALGSGYNGYGRGGGHRIIPGMGGPHGGGYRGRGGRGYPRGMGRGSHIGIRHGGGGGPNMINSNNPIQHHR